MASTSETGHAKNVANFEDLISFCKSYGSAYKPIREALFVSALEQLRTDALAQLQNVKAAKTTFDNATNARQDAFKPLRPLATRVVNALSASGAGALVVADARTINRKLQGVKAPSTPKAVPASESSTGDPTSKFISRSQQSFDSQMEHFAKLIELVSQQPGYLPNEAELSILTLTGLNKSLRNTNSDVVNAYTGWSNSRIRRDESLYNPINGLVETAFAVKNYVKSVFGAASPQYKQVRALQFANRAGK